MGKHSRQCCVRTGGKASVLTGWILLLDGRDVFGKDDGETAGAMSEIIM
jgi:hypothetical protein